MCSSLSFSSHLNIISIQYYHTTGVEDSNRLRVESSPEATTTSSTPPQVRGADSTGGSNAGQRFRSSSRSHGERSNSQSSTPTSTERAGTPSFRNGMFEVAFIVYVL